MRFAVAFSLAVAACAAPDDETRRTNSAPVAALKAPVIAALGQPTRLDGSESYDPDGDALTFTFQFNDGTQDMRSGESVIMHTFETESLYEVVLRITDGRGAESLAAQDVSVTRHFSDPPDFCADSLGCMVGDSCEAGVCYSSGGTLE